MELLGSVQQHLHLCSRQPLLDGNRLGCARLSTKTDPLVRTTNHLALVLSLTIGGYRYSNATVNIITDLATALIPLPVIHSLDITRRQKTILMSVFAVGIL